MPENTEATVDGVRAVELFYRSIKETATNDTVFYRAEIRLNTPVMGTLLPERYMSVIENSDRCIAIFKLAFTQLLQSMKKFNNRSINYSWISIYIPVHFLKSDSAIFQLTNICQKCNVTPENVCFEVSPKLFEETTQTTIINVKKLRELGFHFMITGYGGNYFPILKLVDYNPDYFMLSSSGAASILKSERSKECIKILLDAATTLGAEVIADDISDSIQLNEFKKMECPFYTGGFAGEYVSAKQMRSRGNAE